MEQEIWKTAFENPNYLVSNWGNIKHIKREQNIKPNTSHMSGYLTWVYRNEVNKRARCYVHRSVYQAFHGQIPKGKHIDHINFDRRCNRLDNLQLISHQENLARSRKAGRFLDADRKNGIRTRERFANGGTNKLSFSLAELREAKERYSQGEPIMRIAKTMGKSYKPTWRVCHGKLDHKLI